MIEAVSTPVANNVLAAGGNSRPEDGVRSEEARQTPESSNIREAVSIPYISPVVNVDIQINQAVLEFRDSETGEVQERIPSDRSLKAFERSSRLAEERAADVTVSQDSNAEPESSDTTSDAKSAEPLGALVSVVA